ncbi:MAG: hypothetical protein OEY77_09940 [Nitrospira sp.]|nr:hypothetical protein [Nitrospira sp.]
MLDFATQARGWAWLFASRQCNVKNRPHGKSHKLDEKLRKGSTPNEVLAVLDEFKVDHSDYLTHPVLDGGLAAVLGKADRFAPVNVRHIGAIARDVKKNFLISESIQIFFLFDERDNLVEYKFKRIATGP